MKRPANYLLYSTIATTIDSFLMQEAPQMS
jgi:hypothetical protein